MNLNIEYGDLRAAAAQQLNRPRKNAIGAGLSLIERRLRLRAADYIRQTASRPYIRILLLANILFSTFLRVVHIPCVSVCR